MAIIQGGFASIRRTTAPERSVAAASTPDTGSVHSDTTKKQSMVGDGRKLPNAYAPVEFRDGLKDPGGRPTHEVLGGDVVSGGVADRLDVVEQLGGFDIGARAKTR